jgi:hypothetical protein
VSSVVLLVDVSFVPHPLEKLPHDGLVLRVSRPNEGVVADTELAPQGLELF